MTFLLEQFLVSDSPAVQNWHVRVETNNWDQVDDLGAHERTEIARINIVRGSLLEGNLYDELDAPRRTWKPWPALS